MTGYDQVQCITAFVALLLQVWATFLARPLKILMPAKLWHVLMALNFFVLFRRCLSIAEVVFTWQTQTYQTFTVFVGLGVSVFMFLTITTLRSFVTSEQKRRAELTDEVVAEKQRVQDIADATVELATAARRGHVINIEDSVAYRLAQHFIAQRELLHAAQNGNGK
jgi:hypothetical protein